MPGLVLSFIEVTCYKKSYWELFSLSDKILLMLLNPSLIEHEACSLSFSSIGSAGRPNLFKKSNEATLNWLLCYYFLSLAKFITPILCYCTASSEGTNLESFWDIYQSWDFILECSGALMRWVGGAYPLLFPETETLKSLPETFPSVSYLSVNSPPSRKKLF